MSNDTRKRLEILLKHWAKHNREHSEEFVRWADTAKDFGETAHDAILAAAQQMEKANEFLLQALDSLKEGES
ncbi:MAG: hypothetical protein IMY88_00705 [Chloroflexi bacterium]|nr:hypothetical protein [Chloroflexota bacterium]